MTQENLFTLHAMEMGIYLAFVYDLFRVFRKVIPHGRLWIAAEDIAYWCYCGVKVFLFLRRENNGILRWFAVFAAMAGIWAYLKLASPLFIKYVTMVLKKLLTGICGIVKMIGKGVYCHVRKIFGRKNCKCSQAECQKEKKKSCISQAPTEQGQYVSGVDGGACHCCRDRGECRGPSKKD